MMSLSMCTEVIYSHRNQKRLIREVEPWAESTSFLFCLPPPKVSTGVCVYLYIRQRYQLVEQAVFRRDTSCYSVQSTLPRRWSRIIARYRDVVSNHFQLKFSAGHPRNTHHHWSFQVSATTVSRQSCKHTHISTGKSLISLVSLFYYGFLNAWMRFLNRKRRVVCNFSFFGRPLFNWNINWLRY